MKGIRQHRLRTVLRGGVAFIALGISGAAFAASAAADATDDYPIPHRMITTTCTAEQILAGPGPLHLHTGPLHTTASEQRSPASKPP